MCCRTPIPVRVLTLALCLAMTLALSVEAEAMRPRPRPAGLVDVIPETRWDHRGESAAWTRAALAALKAHGKPLVRTVPDDIAQWCPGYPGASEPVRRAFWVGLLSALAKHESRWRPRAVGGNGRWYGLLQILPATARGYGCRARTGPALQAGADNLSCAIRILATTVPRDGVIERREPRWSGVAADWGPMRSASKRRDMASWLRSRDYCQMTASPRPRPRPATLAVPKSPEPRPRPPQRGKLAMTLGDGTN